MSDIPEAKRRLPLPALMELEGLGKHAKRSALCPFHDDQHNSFSVWQTDSGTWLFKCHAGCGEGDEITFLELHNSVSKGEATKLFLEKAGANGAKLIQVFTYKRTNKIGQKLDWRACVDAFTDADSLRLAIRRGYSREFRSWLKQNGLVGKYRDCVAFPVHDQLGNVVALHYQLPDGSWGYHPQGAKVRPLVIGELVASKPVHVFESQWDAFAFADLSGERSGIVITRGAGNGKLVTGLIAPAATVYAWKQNDDLKNGKRAGDEWLKDVAAHAGTKVLCPKTPEKFKDLNDWTRAGAQPEDLLEAMANAQPALNSLNSRILSFALHDDYPKPLARAAFHGLAGEIVRRIAPHTEADPVALLFQLIAAFGNLIGHDKYIVADGAYHHLNLYGVLVGETSKGRKGTSWNHIANLMQRVDPEWRRNCVTQGLSSGEGLIWEVHDPIEETRPIRKGGRHTGEYETIIANQGEADKRLFISEGEFANVLKVMAREGNTLSPIIRSAWDCGDLRSMVKTCPAKATNAHISIVGHITRDELRRLLTQTESANGFANRFCWLATKRSKCLPDGGAIHTVDFDDVVEQLQQAVRFGEDFLEINRDDAAKELWHAVYPELSEGKPGMAGAATGRAEAQVLRLSAIYALLDKSALIGPEHHEAAMALWDYCEQSVRWIFGTSTGDRNADKILTALRHAPNGLTKTEISAEVFNRHASSTEIDQALRLLHGLRMATYSIEVSGGAPLQRWSFGSEKREISE
jgi:hypothetical protein